MENNWSGKRNKALASIQAVLAQDPESGILCYGDTTIRHLWEKNVVLEFLDFYQSGANQNQSLKYLVFDSKFTVYQNLGVINAKGVKFITIRRKSKALLDRIQNIDSAKWRKIRIQKNNGKFRSLLVYEESISIKEYNGDVRHVYIKDKGKVNPAIMITNDFQISLENLVRKYARRWLVETDISEHIDFFHLNRNSSGIVIKVDFDLTMSILAHNLYKLFCRDFDGYSHCEAQAVFDKFISAPGHIQVDNGSISVRIKKKRTLPILLENMRLFSKTRYSWLFDSVVNFSADSTT